MKIEKIKKDNKLKIVLGIFGLIVLISAVIYVNTRAKYQTIDSIPLARGTVKYNIPDLEVVAILQETSNSSEAHETKGTGEDTKYYKKATSIPVSGFTLNTVYSSCDNGAEFGPSETTGLYVDKITTSGTKCTFYFDEIKGKTINNLIATADKTSITTSADFGVTEPRSGVEPAPGLYEFEGITEGSKTQFYRGAVTNNYVRLGTSGKETYWRIVRFDEEGNIRLIYDGTSAHDNGEASSDRVLTTNYDGTNAITQAYHAADNNPAYVGWTWVKDQQRPNNDEGEYPSGGSSSDMKKYLEETWLPDFKTRLSEIEKLQLTTGKYCNDRTLESESWNIGSKLYFGARKRLETNKTPSFACDTRDTYTLEIGLLTADEYAFAGGGGYNQTNTSFYLYTGGKIWWTMSPVEYYKSGSSEMAEVYGVQSGGYLMSVGTYCPYGIRPIITLDKNTQFDANTTGTKDNPYTIAN